MGEILDQIMNVGPQRETSYGTFLGKKLHKRQYFFKSTSKTETMENESGDEMVVLFVNADMKLRVQCLIRIQ